MKSQVYVVSQTDLMKYMLSQPLITGRIGKWSLALSEFTLVYFLVDHISLEIKLEKDVELGIYEVERRL